MTQTDPKTGKNGDAATDSADMALKRTELPKHNKLPADPHEAHGDPGDGAD